MDLYEKLDRRSKVDIHINITIRDMQTMQS